MGFLTGGIDYDLIGRVGNHVGRRVHGKNVLAMRPARGNRTPSAAQLVIQQKLSLVTAWLSQLSGFIRVGFDDRDPGVSAWNAAVGYNVSNAVTMVASVATIDYAKVLFSDGKLAKAKNMVLSTTVDAQLDFAWSAAVPSLMPGSGTDELVLIVYNPSKQEWEVSVGAVTRAALSYDLLLPADWSGDSVQVWTSFLSADKKVSGRTAFVAATVVM